MKDIVEIADVQSQILEAFSFRHATKLFDETRKIPEAEFDTILEAGRLSPTSFGAEQWQLLMIQTREKRELFRDFAWGANGMMHGTTGQLGSASHFGLFLARTSETMKAGSDYLARHMREVKKFPDEVANGFEAVLRKFQEEDFGLTSDRLLTEWSARQAYIALGNMMTAAALMGIDSCPIEGFDVKQTQATLQEHFGIDPKEFYPAVMVAFGYRAGAPAYPQTRRDLDEVVAWA
ncbi:NAD(P)H-dependent oxidoreductase [Tropicimonas sediminicola]|uniref:Nitroreductase domain-containing protein n=1 Tax=Tropicimonas sediminicola TaxID=1031541 RepID=A0A239FRK6_9RHOB|nr:NAD(P)H-dependent oxidoreductase [Tropicimonas sediminicola]SNS59551.1 hypothetical protein SAMN05421757_102806 [Tropicimonas sediminicola]